MKSPRDKITEEHRRVVRAGNRPDVIRRDEGVLFHNTGSTGWGRIRRLGDYKGNRKEGDFSHLHNKFADPEDAA
jgi:hypothetical protein